MVTKKIEYSIEPQKLSQEHINQYFVIKEARGDEPKYLKIISIAANESEIILYFGGNDKAVIQAHVKKIKLAKDVNFYTIEFTKEELEKVRYAVNYYCEEDVPEGLIEKLELKDDHEGKS